MDGSVEPASLAAPPDLSVSDLARAWTRVRENEGCAGADGVTLARFAARAAKALPRLASALASGLYRPLPLLEILVEKRSGHGTRRLLVPAVRDRIVQTAVSWRLGATLEEEFLDSSFAYRRGRGVDTAIAEVCRWRDEGLVSVVDADISSFFDEVPHSSLLALVRGGLASGLEGDTGLLHVVELWIRCPVWNGERLLPARKGIAQGSPLSPLLANLFLHDLDVSLAAAGFRAVRYADDFVILCPGETEARDALQRTAGWLERNGLQLNVEKTAIRTFKEGFNFLGVHFVEEEVWRPWRERHPATRILKMARPLPPALLVRVLAPPRGPTAMASALTRAGVHPVPPEAAPQSSSGGRTPVAFLYLTTQGSILRKTGDRFLVEKDRVLLFETPAHEIESVLIFGNVVITTPALAECMERGIRVSFLSRTGRLRGHLAMPCGHDVAVRQRQYALALDPAAAMAFARPLISGKIANEREVLLVFNEAQSAGAEELTGWEARAGNAGSIEVLLGCEGAAAKRYFQDLMTFNRSDFVWQGRQRRPPPDPLNTLLSLGYTLLGQEFAALLESLGLDVYLGCLHQPDFGRPSLALDLLECFRAPVVDRFVLTQVNRKVFQAGDFQRHGESGGLRLTTDALGRFLERWERWMLSPPPVRAGGTPAPPFRREVRREAERFVRFVRDGQLAWTPWRWDRFDTPEEDSLDEASATT